MLFENNEFRYSEIAKILDGQHRIEGLKDYKNDNFDLPVTVFVGTDMSDQANIFYNCEFSSN